MIVPRRRLAAALAALAAPAARPAQAGEAAQVAQLVELTGAQSVLGDQFRAGVELAAQDINAGGGLLGRPVQITTYDAQSSAAGARAAMAKLLEGGPIAVLGPALADSARGALPLARDRGTLTLLGSGAADLGAGQRCAFRAVPGDAVMMARLAGWLRDEAGIRHPRLLWSTQEPHRGGREALLKAARQAGLDLAEAAAGGDLAAELGRLLRAPADALVLLLPPEACARAMAEARRLAPSLPLFGAGAPMEGLRAHALLADDPAAPALRGFAERYRQAFKEAPTDLAMAGYVALGAVAAAAARAGSLAPRMLCDALRGWSASVAEAPMLLVDSAWNEAGELSRVSWMVELANGRPVPLRALT